MDHIIGAGVRGISKSIAVVSEVAANKRERRRSSQSKSIDDTSRDSDSDEDILSREQDLDDAISDEELTDTQTKLETTSLTSQPSNSPTDYRTLPIPTNLTPIPQPIILPQRRPRQKSRGFIRAYPPSLLPHSGITQETFMQFLADFDASAKAWPIFLVLNIASNALGAVPEHTFMIASTAIQAVAYAGEELQTRYTTNTFLDSVNDQLFKPRGLYALIMTYKPDMADETVLQADLSDPHSVALSKALSREAGNSLAKKLSRFRGVSAGTAKESQLGEPAPLIYPALDAKLLPNTTGTATDNAAASTALAKSPSNAAVIQDYLDRRARAVFTASNPNSTLTSTLPPEEKTFVNRYADPNHPVNSGSVFGLVTGGTWDPIAAGRVRRASRKARKNGEPELTEAERHDAYMGRKVRDRVTGTPSKSMFGLKGVFVQNVMYLGIVNLPKGEGAEV